MDGGGALRKAETLRAGLRRYLPLLSLPAIFGPLAVLAFIVISERAHDEDRCEARAVARRPLAPGVVVEEQVRNCIADVREHRFMLYRDGVQRLLGRRRFHESVFEAPGYGWDAGVSDQGEVHVRVWTPGHGRVDFREGPRSSR